MSLAAAVGEYFVDTYARKSQVRQSSGLWKPLGVCAATSLHQLSRPSATRSLVVVAAALLWLFRSQHASCLRRLLRHVCHRFAYRAGVSVMRRLAVNELCPEPGCCGDLEGGRSFVEDANSTDVDGESSITRVESTGCGLLFCANDNSGTIESDCCCGGAVEAQPPAMSAAKFQPCVKTDVEVVVDAIIQESILTLAPSDSCGVATTDSFSKLGMESGATEALAPKQDGEERPSLLQPQDETRAGITQTAADDATIATLEETELVQQQQCSDTIDGPVLDIVVSLNVATEKLRAVVDRAAAKERMDLSTLEEALAEATETALSLNDVEPSDALDEAEVELAEQICAAEDLVKLRRRAAAGARRVLGSIEAESRWWEAPVEDHARTQVVTFGTTTAFGDVDR